VWAAAAVPASVLTTARKLKYSWILRRFPFLILRSLSVRSSKHLVSFENKFVYDDHMLLIVGTFAIPPDNLPAARPTHTPAYKEASVSMRVLPEATSENPLPRTNSRFGHPTPQNGVEVERKWKRPDYSPPGQWTGTNSNEVK
jgi:hypothetical protein